MKRIVALTLCMLLMAAVVFTGCSKDSGTPADEPNAPAEEPGEAPVDEAPVAEVTDDPSVTTLNIYSFTVEVPDMLTKYAELNPDFTMEVNRDHRRYHGRRVSARSGPGAGGRWCGRPRHVLC